MQQEEQKISVQSIKRPSEQVFSDSGAADVTVKVNIPETQRERLSNQGAS